MDLEEIRKKKLQSLKEQAEHEEARKNVLAQTLTPQARERLNTVRIAHPELAQTVELTLIQALQSGQFAKRVDDETLKELLTALKPKKRDFIIRRK
ncbi:hypothetical protein COT72_01395 [archaeon CG10_big_fil_rev_8_21_14_0_10_43_11]|nr:MAG: hypothetical protein COT72_01395 [archaeon CG10_big_fil_rev_8_21_14_0_10_43_11]